jgi:tRNA A-37 threonylcarbamoyl transferase component Bud32
MARNLTPTTTRGTRIGRYFEPPAWEWASAGAVGWWVRPGWRDILLGPGGLRLDEWRREGRLRTIKAGPHRVVYRVELPGPHGPVFIKHFLVPNLRSTLRQWFRRGKGRNEAKRAERLAAAGVPTSTAVALGEQRRRGFLFENYLVTREIAGTTPLDEFVERHLPRLPADRRTEIRRRLAETLGATTARLHDGGFLHTDFHPGNLLIQLDASDRPQFAMIDLDALRVRPVVREREAIANLALLNHYFWIRSSRSDRCRFLRAYAGARGWPAARFKELARAVEDRTRDWAERLWRRWGRRCLGDNKYFATYRGPHSWAVATRELAPDTVEHLLQDPDAPLGQPQAALLKDSRTTTVADVALPVGGVPTRVIYKRFNRKKALDPFYTLFRPSRAWRAWCNGQHLASRGIPTPRNLAVIGRTAIGRRFLPHQFWPHDTYLITVKEEPSVTVGDFVRTTLPALPAAGRRACIRRLIPALAHLIRRLHERSLSHRDLKADNILIAGTGLGPEIGLSLIDLVGVQIEHPITRHHQVQNLARLQLSLASARGRTRTDSLRFLRAYLPWARIADSSWKPLWREIEDACRKKVDRNRRNNRKLS